MTSTSPPVSRLAHRAGPVEHVKGREIQRCLRCDCLVFVASEHTPKPYRLGRRVFLNTQPCPGATPDS